MFVTGHSLQTVELVSSIFCHFDAFLGIWSVGIICQLSKIGMEFRTSTGIRRLHVDLLYCNVSYSDQSRSVPFVEVHYLIAKKTLDEVLFHTLEKKTLSVGPQLPWNHECCGLDNHTRTLRHFRFNLVWIPCALKNILEILIQEWFETTCEHCFMASLFDYIGTVAKWAVCQESRVPTVSPSDFPKLEATFVMSWALRTKV